VIQADGGTRTASITGAYVALVLALSRLYVDGNMQSWPVVDAVAAISVGMIGGVACLDLNYQEDSKAGVDMNVIGTDKGRFVELQGTAEGSGSSSFSEEEMNAMLSLAKSGIATLVQKQREVLAPSLARVDTVAREKLNRKFR
jgi:ribonuclease PH